MLLTLLLRLSLQRYGRTYYSNIFICTLTFIEAHYLLGAYICVHYHKTYELSKPISDGNISKYVFISKGRTNNAGQYKM